MGINGVHMPVVARATLPLSQVSSIFNSVEINGNTALLVNGRN